MTPWRSVITMLLTDRRHRAGFGRIRQKACYRRNASRGATADV